MTVSSSLQCLRRSLKVAVVLHDGQELELAYGLVLLKRRGIRREDVEQIIIGKVHGRTCAIRLAGPHPVLFPFTVDMGERPAMTFKEIAPVHSRVEVVTGKPLVHSRHCSGDATWSMLTHGDRVEGFGNLEKYVSLLNGNRFDVNESP